MFHAKPIKEAPRRLYSKREKKRAISASAEAHPRSAFRTHRTEKNNSTKLEHLSPPCAWSELRLHTRREHEGGKRNEVSEGCCVFCIGFYIFASWCSDVVSMAFCVGARDKGTTVDCAASLLLTLLLVQCSRAHAAYDSARSLPKDATEKVDCCKGQKRE